MGEKLKRNICGLDDHVFLSDVKDLSDRQKEHIGDTLGYACCFWTKHLLGVSGTGSVYIEEVQEVINKFFTTSLLFWIEVLSLLGKLDIGIYALNDIQEWYTLVSHVWNVCSGLLCSHLSR